LLCRGELVWSLVAGTGSNCPEGRRQRDKREKCKNRRYITRRKKIGRKRNRQRNNSTKERK